MLIYVGTYGYLSANGRYEPVLVSLTGIHSLMWAPQGFFPERFQENGSYALMLSYLPIWYLDARYWHPYISFGEKTKYSVDEASLQGTTLWTARVYLSPPKNSYYNYKKYVEDRPEAVKELSNHPLKMLGTILYGHDGLYVVQASSNALDNSTANNKGGGVKHAAITDLEPMVLDGKGGQCFLVSSQPYTTKQTITITVYPAGRAPIGEEQCPSYSDDPNLAYTSGYMNPW